MKLHYLKQNHQRTVTAIHTRHSIQAFTQTLQAWKEQQKEYGLDQLIADNGYDQILVLYSFDSFKSDPYLYRAGAAG